MKEWQYTQEQAKAIKNGDIEARNAFYMENLNRIQIMARAYVSCGRAKGLRQVCTAEELTQQVYLDLPLFNYDSPQTISFSLKRRSFFLCKYGGWSYFVENGRSATDYPRYMGGESMSIEERANEDGNSRPLLDLLISLPSAAEEYEKREKETQDYSATLQAVFEKYLAKRQADFLVLWCEGYSDTDAASKIGTKIQNVHKKKAFDRLRVNYADIVDTLCAAGCESAYGYITLTPALLEQSRQALTATPEQKAKAAARMREKRAKQKAQRATV